MSQLPVCETPDGPAAEAGAARLSGSADLLSLRRVRRADDRGRPLRGSSRFVGVYRHGNKWQAHITCRGKYYYLGLFDDEVAAAKARDRKAWELHGEFAYLNFPEDYGL